jgi:AhpD family alkylhydroperoxidase
LNVERKVKELIGIAASVAAGCEPCLESHVESAKSEGAGPDEIAVAIQIARAVRLTAVTKIDDAAARLQRGESVPLVPAGSSSSCCGDGCDC